MRYSAPTCNDFLSGHQHIASPWKQSLSQSIKKEEKQKKVQLAVCLRERGRRIPKRKRMPSFHLSRPNRFIANSSNACAANFNAGRETKRKENKEAKLGHRSLHMQIIVKSEISFLSTKERVLFVNVQNSGRAR